MAKLIIYFVEWKCFHEKMERFEQKKYITGLLRRYSLDKREVFSAISPIKSNPDRLDRYNKVVRDLPLWSVEFGCIPGKDSSYYVFNGKYFEKTAYDVIEVGLEAWLEEMGVGSLDRNRRSLYTYMCSVLSRVRDRVLRPDLSVMCFENGVVDMSRLRLEDFSPRFDVVKQYPFRYDRREIMNCVIWKSFLGESWLPIREMDGVLPEKDKRRLLQMFLGACLVNRKNISFEYFMILQGTGANGKSVIYRVLQDMFGSDEILNIKLSQFAKGGDEQLRAAFSMDGKRLMYCTESTRSDFVDTSTLKAISSGEPIACREIGGNITMMQRPPVMICNSNYRWKQADFLNRDDPEDMSMQRRAVIVNFEKTIPTDKRDTLLAERMRSEQAGIFAWMVKGLCELKKNGWKMPETVNGKIDEKLNRMRSTVVTDDGRRIDGSVSEWLLYKKCWPLPAENRVKVMFTSSELKRNYERFCKRAGVVPVSQRKLSLDLLAMGYERRQVSGKGNASTYTLWCDDAEIAEKFMKHVPNIAEDVKNNLFVGFEYTDEEFLEDWDDDGEE